MKDEQLTSHSAESDSVFSTCEKTPLLTEQSETKIPPRALLGGTFDPPHWGHIALAEAAREECSLDEVWLTPAHLPVFKQDTLHTPAHHRIAMCKEAIRGFSGLSICSIELERKGTTYTIDTLRALEGRIGYFIIGEDAFLDLGRWKDAYEIASQVIFIVGRRTEKDRASSLRLDRICMHNEITEVVFPRVCWPHPAIPLKAQVKLLATSIPQISSTDIRMRVTRGLDVSDLVPCGVSSYITAHNLYQ